MSGQFRKPAMECCVKAENDVAEIVVLWRWLGDKDLHTMFMTLAQGWSVLMLKQMLITGCKVTIRIIQGLNAFVDVLADLCT